MERHKSQKQHDDDLAKRRIKRKAKKEVERKQDKTFWTWFIAIVVCVCVVGALFVKAHSRSAADKRVKDELDQNGGAKGKPTDRRIGQEPVLVQVGLVSVCAARCR